MLLIGAPGGFEEVLELPPEVKLTRRAGKSPYDVIVFFTKVRSALARELARLRKLSAPACGLWISWPKKASKVVTDMAEDVVCEIALPAGLVDNKVCALDDVCSGLRLVIRKELR